MDGLQAQALEMIEGLERGHLPWSQSAKIAACKTFASQFGMAVRLGCSLAGALLTAGRV